MRITSRQWVVLALLLPAVISFALATVEGNRLRRLHRGAGAEDPGVRAAAFERIARQRYQPALDMVLHALSAEEDREVLERAGYAAARMEARDAVPLLQRRVVSTPDDTVRAALATYVARASGRDTSLADWFRAGVESSAPWRRVGSAAGLLELGLAEGGERLMAIMQENDPGTRAFAYGKLVLLARPLTEAIGQPLHWPRNATAFMDSPDWPKLQTLWREHVSTRFVTDTLNRPGRSDERWHQIGRLLRGRQHLGYWLGLGPKPS
jgi:hypothetical protein